MKSSFMHRNELIGQAEFYQRTVLVLLCKQEDSSRHLQLKCSLCTFCLSAAHVASQKKLCHVLLWWFWTKGIQSLRISWLQGRNRHNDLQRKQIYQSNESVRLDFIQIVPLKVTAYTGDHTAHHLCSKIRLVHEYQRRVEIFITNHHPHSLFCFTKNVSPIQFPSQDTSWADPSASIPCLQTLITTQILCNHMDLQVSDCALFSVVPHGRQARSYLSTLKKQLTHTLFHTSSLVSSWINRRFLLCHSWCFAVGLIMRFSFLTGISQFGFRSNARTSKKEMWNP